MGRQALSVVATRLSSLRLLQIAALTVDSIPTPAIPSQMYTVGGQALSLVACSLAILHLSFTLLVGNDSK